MAKKKNRKRKAKKSLSPEKPQPKKYADCRFSESYWSLWDYGVNQSFLNTFNSCREQARCMFVEGLKTAVVPDSVEFGTVFHDVLQRINRLNNRPSHGEIKQYVIDYENKWNEEYGAKYARLNERQQQIYGQVEATLQGYVSRWASDWTGKRKRGDVIAPNKWVWLEEKFRVDVEIWEGYKIPVFGTFDGVFIDAKKGIWLFESKTKSTIDDDRIQDTLPMDLQVNLYLWALYRIFGKTPSGVLYNIIRRPGLKYCAKDKDIAEYVARVAKDVELRPDYYFKRFEMGILKSEIENFEEKTLRPMLETVALWYTGETPHYCNPSALYGRFGKAFMYDAIVRNDVSDYIREARHVIDIPETSKPKLK